MPSFGKRYCMVPTSRGLISLTLTSSMLTFQMHSFSARRWFGTDFTKATLAGAQLDGAVMHFLFTERDDPYTIHDATPILADAIGLDPKYGPSTPRSH